MAQIDKFLTFMVERRGSDLHLSSGSPPNIRVDGDMLKMNMGALNKDQVWGLITEIIPDHNKEQVTKDWDTDFAYELTGVARFRCNVFMDRKGPGMVMRTIPAKIWTCDDLGLTREIRQLCLLPKGLVIVTGPTGSGKSTTLAALVRECNEKRKDHIITIEDPIEFVHENINCLINQREVHQHTRSFLNALRAALREDPDIVLVGEMRDLETVRIALETAETGHLVFATLHTNTAASTVDRIIDQFQAEQQEQIRVMLSTNLKAVVAQTLLKRKAGGRIASLEIMMVTSAIANLIRENKTFQIPSQIETGKKYGMMPLNDALLNLVEKGIVDPKEAYMKALDKMAYTEKAIGVLLSMVKSGQIKPMDAVMAVYNPTELLNGFQRIGLGKDMVEQLRSAAEKKLSTEMEM